MQQPLHHHTQTLKLIWLTVPGSWNNLSIALRLSLVLVLNLLCRSLLQAEDVPLVVFQLEQYAPVVPAAREQPVQQHPAELGWSTAFEASVVASVATEQEQSLQAVLRENHQIAVFSASFAPTGPSPTQCNSRPVVTRKD
ncbi:hypothetical protein F2Q69_00035963 [Brassica cretica]|uniref:Uncharacterized protein n=1 Tax=Brassica cretica TaxID=69181 RepID=A0A8S9SGA6_BRACR|nr:hypothetical protein F2Q69_00035963 [Brassica cretica]